MTKRITLNFLNFIKKVIFIVKKKRKIDKEKFHQKKIIKEKKYNIVTLLYIQVINFLSKKENIYY